MVIPSNSTEMEDNLLDLWELGILAGSGRGVGAPQHQLPGSVQGLRISTVYIMRAFPECY